MINVHRIDTNLTTLDVGRGRPSSSSAFEEWESFKILFHDFRLLPSAVGENTASPELTCNGHRWCIILNPGGYTEDSAGYLSLVLSLCSGGCATATFEVSVLDKFHKTKHFTEKFMDCSFDDETNSSCWGWDDFCSRSYILNQSKNILDDNGTLALVVSIKKDSAAPFVPNNPMSSMITSMFLDKETADACFEVGTEVDSDDGDEVALSPVTFHAHRLILKKCAPMLASLFGSDDEEIVTASITDVKSAIFRHLLHYVYGGSVPEWKLVAHAKDIINAADKFSIVNLKLQAEAAYVKSIKIAMDNAMDNLLYADARNCALLKLKEVVIDFLADNHVEAIGSLSFTDVPGDVVKDLVVAFGRKMKDDTNEGSTDDFTTMRVSELRKKLDEKGLNVDGSRETMIEALRARASEPAGSKRRRKY